MEENKQLDVAPSVSESPEASSGDKPEESVRKLKANPDFLLREVAGEAVLIPVGEAGVFENSVISLNDTCCFLWKLFQTPRTIEDVIAEAKKEYSDPDGAMEHGIYSFISDYLKYGLLVEEE